MGFGFEKPEYAFGVTEPLSLDRVAPDAAFLEWGERSNAAAIVASCLESDLLGSDEAAAGVSQSEQQLDQLALMFGLLRFCRERWAGQDVGLLALADSYLRIGRDPAVRKTWLEAAAISTQGAQLHYQQPQQAFEAYNLALRKFEEAGDLKGIGRNIGNIALLNLEAGSLTDAIKLAGRALLIHQRVDYHRGQMMHLLNLAKAHAQLKHWDKALQARRVRQSIEHWIDPTEAAFSEAHVALCLRESGDESAARESFDKALLLAGRLQFPDQFANLAQALAPLADAWNQRQRVESVLSRAQAECVTTLGQLDAQPLFGSGPILLKFREALPTMDRQALHEAVAANRRWAVALVESLLVQNLFHSLNGDQATAASADQLAGALALQLCRSWHLRWPFDEVTLFRSWPTGKKVAKAKAYDAKARGLYLAWQGERVQGRELLTAAAALHEMIGDPYAVAPWFSEVFRELDMLGEDRAAMYGAVYHSDALAARGDEERALDGLMRALEIAREKGSRLNVADKYIRLAIFHHRRNQMDAAAHWFQSAEIAFRELDAVGLSASDELGRINNGIKLAVHLGEYLRDAGRYGELAFVLVPALHETDWFIETFGDTAGEYLQRAKDYKGRMLYCLAKGYSRLGGFEKSLDYARRMAAWYELLQDPRGQAAAHQAISIALNALGRTSEALVEAIADLEIQRNIGDPREIAIALETAAGLYLKLGRFGEAEAAAKEGLTLVEHGDNLRSEKADALFTLGEIADTRRDWTEASRCYRAALEVDESLSRPDAALMSRVALARALLNNGKAAEAAVLTEEAWNRSTKVQSFVCRYAAGLCLAQCKIAGDLRKEWYEAADILIETCRLTTRMRREVQDEAHKVLQAVRHIDPFHLLIEVLAVLSVEDASTRRNLFGAVEQAKARALIESISASAEREAERKTGWRWGGLSGHVADAREELVRSGYDDLLQAMRREAGLETADARS